MCARVRPALAVTRELAPKWRSRPARPSASSPARNCRLCSNRVVPRLSVEALRAEFAFTRSTIGTRKLLLHGALFLATLLTTSIVGVVFAQSFQAGRPIDLDQYVD